MSDETRARVLQLETKRHEAHRAFMAACDAEDVDGMIGMSRRIGEMSEEITRLTNPEAWQARQLLNSWPEAVHGDLAHWLVGYQPDLVLLFELSRRNLTSRPQREG